MHSASFPGQRSVHDRRSRSACPSCLSGGVLPSHSLLTTQAVVELDKVDMATFAKAEGKLLSMQHAG